MVWNQVLGAITPEVCAQQGVNVFQSQLDSAPPTPSTPPAVTSDYQSTPPPTQTSNGEGDYSGLTSNTAASSSTTTTTSSATTSSAGSNPPPQTSGGQQGLGIYCGAICPIMSVGQAIPPGELDAMDVTSGLAAAGIALIIMGFMVPIKPDFSSPLLPAQSLNGIPILAGTGLLFKSGQALYYLLTHGPTATGAGARRAAGLP